MIQDGTKLYFDIACMTSNRRDAPLVGRVRQGVAVGHCSTENQMIYGQWPIGTPARWIDKRFLVFVAEPSAIIRE